jgi:hypothetical protein
VQLVRDVCAEHPLFELLVHFEALGWGHFVLGLRRSTGLSLFEAAKVKENPLS